MGFQEHKFYSYTTTVIRTFQSVMVSPPNQSLARRDPFLKFGYTK